MKYYKGVCFSKFFDILFYKLPSKNTTNYTSFLKGDKHKTCDEQVRCQKTNAETSKTFFTKILSTTSLK